MLNNKIEFHGKILSMRAISLEIGISRETLQKYYDKTGDIYETEKICRDILEQKRGSLVEYNGEMLAIQTIAKREGLKDSKTLKKYYEQTGNIYEAIENYNKGRIEYNGELLTLDAIAKKEGLKGDTLKRYLQKGYDIYKAVEICKENRLNAETTKVMYKGQKRTLTSIARELGISKGTLKKYYEQTQNIDKAIELYSMKKQEVEDSKIEYKGKKKFLKEIAREENIAETTLTRYLEKYGYIDKAVFMAKVQRNKSKQVKIKDGDVNLYDLSIILGIKYSELMNSINSGMSIEEIKKQNKGQKRNKEKQEITKLPDGQTLLEYCVKNGLNYSYIYRAINTYGKSINEATMEYLQNGSNLPNKWVFEKYGLLLRHLMTKNNIDIQRVVDYMRKEQLSMSEAIEKYIIRKNAKIDKLDLDWMQEVYAVLSDENMEDEYEEFKKAFYIDKKEERCVRRSSEEIENIERKLLLYEIVEAIEEKTFAEEEIPELLQVYNIKDNEIETMYLELYKKFNNGIALGDNQSEIQRREEINNITRKWYNLTEEDRKRIITQNLVTNGELEDIINLSRKINKYKNMIGKFNVENGREEIKNGE